MRPITILILVSALACSGGPAEPTALTAPPVDQETLASGVLSAEDVGEGWVAEPGAGRTTIQIGGRFGAADIDDAVGEATSAFTDATGATVSSTVFWMPSEEAAVAAVDAHREAASVTTWDQDRTDRGTSTFTADRSIALTGAEDAARAEAGSVFSLKIDVAITGADGSSVDRTIEYVAYHLGPLVGIVVAEDADVAPFVTAQIVRAAAIVGGSDR